MAGRAVDWYRSWIGDEAKREDIRVGLADALYLAARWREARGVVAYRTPGPTDRFHEIWHRGRLGAIAARLGDRAEARRIADELRRS